MAPSALRVAVEGCGHGTLNAIYASIKKACEAKGWNGIDLLIIGGDFQAVRNATDLNCMAVPPKYRQLGDFHEYYSGKRRAPYLTIFIGGNHEASNHLTELFYGGWVAPKIYYMGAANVLNYGGVRIAGLSGIWKGFDYRRPHHERLPYSKDDERSVYHVREIEVRKFKQLRSQVDVGISHDWPRGVEWKGDHKTLFRWKGHLRDDAERGVLGSIAAKDVMDHLRPPYWFSAHLHVKYAAIINYEKKATPGNEAAQNAFHNDPYVFDVETSSDEDESPALKAEQANPSETNAVRELEQAKPIQNTTTRFLALDKCLPKKDFLQLLEIHRNPSEIDKDTLGFDADRAPRLCYDPEWLAITRALAPYISIGPKAAEALKSDLGEHAYRPLIEKEQQWIHDHVIVDRKWFVPENFEKIAPEQQNSQWKPNTRQMPQEFRNPQTRAFCGLLGIPEPLGEGDS